MDQIISNQPPPLTFALVNLPNVRAAATLAFRSGALLGQLAWDGYAPEYRGKLALGQHVFDGTRVICANGAYGEAEAYTIRPVEDFILKLWNGGAA